MNPDVDQSIGIVPYDTMLMGSVENIKSIESIWTAVRGVSDDTFHVQSEMVLESAHCT